MANNPEKIKVIFEGREWEFDYSPEFDENHFRKLLATEVPNIVNAKANISYLNQGKIKVIKFEKALQYKG